jgi:hypothetical protein
MMEFNWRAYQHFPPAGQISYVRNDPINLVDPDGREPWIWDSASQSWIDLGATPIQINVTAPMFYWGFDFQMILRALYSEIPVELYYTYGGGGGGGNSGGNSPKTVVGLDSDQQKMSGKAYNLALSLLSNPACGSVFGGNGSQVLSSIDIKYEVVPGIVFEDVLMVPSEYIAAAYDPINKAIKINKNGDYFSQSQNQYPGSLSRQTNLTGDKLRALDCCMN